MFLFAASLPLSFPAAPQVNDEAVCGRRGSLPAIFIGVHKNGIKPCRPRLVVLSLKDTHTASGSFGKAAVPDDLHSVDLRRNWTLYPDFGSTLMLVNQKIKPRYVAGLRVTLIQFQMIVYLTNSEERMSGVV